MSAPQRTNLPRWEAAGLVEQYVGGYTRTISVDQYVDNTVARNAWRAGYEDWLQDVANERIATATIEELSREFVFDLGDFVDVSVGAVTWVNAARRFYTEADYKVCGEVWRVHKSDADPYPYPSNPHAHCVGGAKRFLGCTLHLGTAELFRKRTPFGRFLNSDNFERLIDLIRPKFPSVTLPLNPR